MTVSSSTTFTGFRVLHRWRIPVARRRYRDIAGWIAAIVGLWILAWPFTLSGAIGSGTPMYSNVVVGDLALVLVGYAGWEL